MTVPADAAVVVVTGCSSGFGLATAEAFARRGHRVFAGVRSPARAASLEEVAAAYPSQVDVVELDVTSEESVEAAVSKVLAAAERIDVLVNNAGISGGGAVEEVPASVFRALMDTNFHGSVRMMQAVLPVMRTAGSGSVINVSSASARVPGPLLGPYAASKAALEAVCEAAYFELEPFGVRVRVLEAAMYRTRISENSVSGEPRPDSPYFPLVQRIAETRAPIASARGPEEVAAAIVAAAFGADRQFRLVVGEHTAALLEAYASSSWDEWAERVRTAPGRR